MKLVIAVGNGDRLQQHDTLGCQSVGADPEELVQVVASDRFDHLDRYELVVATGEIAIVLEQDFDALR